MASLDTTNSFAQSALDICSTLALQHDPQGVGGSCIPSAPYKIRAYEQQGVKILLEDVTTTLQVLSVHAYKGIPVLSAHINPQTKTISIEHYEHGSWYDSIHQD